MECSYDGTLYSNGKEQITDIHNYLYEFNRQCFLKGVRHKTVECTIAFIWSSKTGNTIQWRREVRKVVTHGWRNRCWGEYWWSRSLGESWKCSLSSSGWWLYGSLHMQKCIEIYTLVLWKLFLNCTKSEMVKFFKMVWNSPSIYTIYWK